jgi:lipoprotein NlpD
MYPCAPSRWRLLLLCATLTTLTGCVSAHRPAASNEATAAQASSASTAADALVPVEAGFYRVNAGDTLVSIAKSFGRAPTAVARWNKMSATDAISAGQILRVAPPESVAPKSVAVPTAKPAASAKLGAAPAPAPAPASASASASASAEASRFKWPVPGPVTAKFVTGRSNGVELGGRVGEPVKAAAGGRVVYAGARVKPYGRLIVIKHDGHFVTAYGNIRKLLVEEGTVVTQGQTIAEMGADASGNGSLKFEVRKDGKPVDPSIYSPKRPG